MCTSCNRGRSNPPAPKPRANMGRSTGGRRSTITANSFGTPKVKMSFSNRRRSG